jgi:hypothetical protein
MDLLRKMLMLGGSQPSLPVFMAPQVFNSTEPLPYEFYERAIGDQDTKEKKVEAFAQIVESC